MYDKRKLATAGKGWFVARLANDLLGTKYNLVDSSYRTRENAYIHLKNQWHSILLDLKGSINKKVRVEKVLDSRQIEDLIEEFFKRGLLASASKKTPKVAKKTAKASRISNAEMLDAPAFGPDRNTNNIHYEEGIPDDEKVLELAAFLEEEYGRIIQKILWLCHNFDIHIDFDLIRIPVVLCKKTPVDCYPVNNKWKSNQIKNLIRNGNFASDEEIDKIIFKNQLCFRVCGMYFPFRSRPTNIAEWNKCEDPYIEIYYRNFTATTIDEYKRIATSILAHEYMHYFHNCLVGISEFSKNSDDDKKVKESIADFFSMWYMVDDYDSTKCDIAERKYYNWEELECINYPYSYALWFFSIGGTMYVFSRQCSYYDRNGILEKYCRVLNIRNFGDAYRQLTI